MCIVCIKMFDLLNIKNRMSLALVRAHLCTLAIAVSFNSVWRVPMDSFRYGGLQFLLVQSVAMIVIALPVTLLQLAAGQLSQQDAVGMWRAVPFFKGVGYLRLLITFVGSIHTIIYVALTASYFLFTLSNPVSLLECIKLEAKNTDDYENEENLCLNHTTAMPEPVLKLPEHYVAVGLIAASVWIFIPFMLYNPFKYMKRIFYVLGPLVLILLVIVTVGMGHKEGLTSFHSETDWRNFVEPRIWHDAITQALWSSQVAGGYLVSIGGNVYSNTNVQWTALILIGANILTSWLGTLLWFAITRPVLEDSLESSLLVQAHHAANERGIPVEWHLILFVTIFLSGIISVITLLYPLYDRFSRMGDRGWRLKCTVSSFVGILFTVGVLLLRLPALHLLEKIIAPFLISFSTILEITAFVFIYGWKTIVDDIKFLSDGEMRKFWILGWCATPGVIIPFMVWWIAKIFIEDYASLESVVMIATAGLAVIIFFSFALFTVLRQEQYDCCSKILSSFRPSRHWGPRDPITHYYWLARREEDRGNAAWSRYHRRYLNQLYEQSNSVIAADSHYESVGNAIGKLDEKQQRTESDDLVYTICRRQHLKNHDGDIFEVHKQRPKSLDWDLPAKLRARDINYQADGRSLGTGKQSIVRIDTVVPIDVRRISHDPR